ncbi:MAG: sialate O-acetylesterase [Thermoguttaceae bacterium]
MKKMLTLVCVSVATALSATAIWADVKLPAIFSSNMVLQQGRNVPVWGWADPAEEVTVAFGDASVKTTTGADGRWQVTLPPMNANAEGRRLTVTGKNTVSCDNVLVGEVWMCSGQSNMQWSVRASKDAENEIAAANYPTIRLFQTKNTWNSLPQTDTDASWQVCSPETVPNFSAVGYFFGREINKELNVPVGVINSSWGGTRIEPWTTPAGFRAVPALAEISASVETKVPGSETYNRVTREVAEKFAAWKTAFDRAIEENTLPPLPPEYPANLRPYDNHQQPTVLYNTQIHPVVPFAIQGTLWYQGESNVGEGMVYADKMRALIAGWRDAFKNPKLPIYFVQLAPYHYGNQDPGVLPTSWEAQEKFAESDDHAGMVVIHDIGNINDIHPTNKQEVGRRLALLAFKNDYGRTDIAAESPILEKMERNGGEIVLTFTRGKSLATLDGKAPSHFEVAGADGIFHAADATIRGTEIVLSSPEVKEPYLVRYGWHKTAEPNVINEAKLPLGAFRAGSIPLDAEIGEFLGSDAKDYAIAYKLDMLDAVAGDNNATAKYIADGTTAITKPFTRVAYLMVLTDTSGKTTFGFTSMDAFTTDIRKIGLPTTDSGAVFQTRVKNLVVKSNVDGVAVGEFAEGNIEFWPNNYSAQNAANVPGASQETYDFGDTRSGENPGHGSFQVHNFEKKQTVLAFNNWKSRREAELGIGNSPTGNPDWTFIKSAANCKRATLYVLVK